MLLTINRKSFVIAGSFTGILWFYWIGNSFQYYDLAFLKYPVILGIGLGYALLFYLMTIFNKTWFRALAIFLVSFVHPMGFNWFMPELALVDSYLPFSKAYFALILALIYMFVKLNGFKKAITVVPLLFITYSSGIYIDSTGLKISMPQLMTSQNQKWQQENLAKTIDKNLSLVDNAIKEESDLIILPETVFPVVLNTEEF